MRPPIPHEPSEEPVRRAYSTPQLTRFGALRELTLGPGSHNNCDNAISCGPIAPKTR